MFRVKHVCRGSVKTVIDMDKGAYKCADCLIRTRDGRTLRVVQEVTKDTFRCVLVRTRPFTTTSDLGLRLPWDMVGVRK